MTFDFEHAVSVPFRMQPGLRRIAPGALHLTPVLPGSRHQREKLAVLSAFAGQALLATPDFDARPALGALATRAAAEHPTDFGWDGQRATAARLGVAVEDDRVVQFALCGFGLGDEIGRCLEQLPAGWRLAGLLSLAFEEDFAIVDGDSGRIPWLAVTLPSHWAPEEKVGRHFAEVHAPVADNRLLIAASDRLAMLVTGADEWERFVWTITANPRLHAHPGHADATCWPATRESDTLAAHAWWRTERQTFIGLAELRQAVFTIHVRMQPLVQALAEPSRAGRVRDALASMSEAVLAYRGLAAVRAPLLDWLSAQARRAEA
jgi:hypothetical protein